MDLLRYIFSCKLNARIYSLKPFSVGNCFRFAHNISTHYWVLSAESKKPTGQTSLKNYYATLRKNAICANVLFASSGYSRKHFTHIVRRILSRGFMQRPNATMWVHAYLSLERRYAEILSLLTVSCYSKFLHCGDARVVVYAVMLTKHQFAK